MFYMLILPALKLMLSLRTRHSVYDDPQTSCGRGHQVFKSVEGNVSQSTQGVRLVMVWVGFMAWNKIKYALVIAYKWK